jgi:hypothetical protein
MFSTAPEAVTLGQVRNLSTEVSNKQTNKQVWAGVMHSSLVYTYCTNMYVAITLALIYYRFECVITKRTALQILRILL